MRVHKRLYKKSSWTIFSNDRFTKDPEALNVSLYKIEHLGKELFDISAIYIFRHHYNAYWHICFRIQEMTGRGEAQLVWIGLTLFLRGITADIWEICWNWR